MPIDLADYSKPIRQALKRAGLACVYVVSADVGDPRCRVGYAIDLPAAVGRLQRSSPAALKLESALWVPDRGIATNIARAAQCDLAGHKTAGGWLLASAEIAKVAIEMAAFRVYPGAITVSHSQLVIQQGSDRSDRGKGLKIIL